MGVLPIQLDAGFENKRFKLSGNEIVDIDLLILKKLKASLINVRNKHNLTKLIKSLVKLSGDVEN